MPLHVYMNVAMNLMWFSDKLFNDPDADICIKSLKQSYKCKEKLLNVEDLCSLFVTLHCKSYGYDTVNNQCWITIVVLDYLPHS